MKPMFTLFLCSNHEADGCCLRITVITVIHAEGADGLSTEVFQILVIHFIRDTDASASLV